jgi:hypothetical protein
MPEGTLGLKSRSDVKAHHTIRMTTKVETEVLRDINLVSTIQKEG